MKSRLSRSSLFVATVLMHGVAQAQATPPVAPATPAVPPPVGANATGTPPASEAAIDPNAAKISGLSDQLAIQRADIDEQDARMAELDGTVKRLSAELAARPKLPPAAPVVAPAAAESHLKINGYVQAQFETHQESQDQLAPGGGLLNADRFSIRRARLQFRGNWQYSSVFMELDGNTTRGPAFSIHHAEASLLYRGNRTLEDAPLAQLSVGLFDNPFGYEVLESPRFRPFVERTQISRGFFPAEPDIGVRLSGKLGVFRGAAAFVNGEPSGQRTGFPLQDPNSHKDFVARFGVDVPIAEKYGVSGGVSVLNGRGFHPGSDNTKGTVIWKDSNEDGAFTPDELTAVPGLTGSPSKNFKRWAINVDLMFSLQDPLGKARVYGEFTLGSNMDRGTYLADPIAAGGNDFREVGYYVALVQEAYRYGLVGFRYDGYNPNSDFLDSRGGKQIPSSQTISTFAPLIGLQIPDRLRFVVEYDVIRDHLGRDTRGVPRDRSNNAWTLRLQGEL